MSGTMTAGQHALVKRKSRPKEIDPAEEGGELNIVPFLDIITNILMFILATITTVFTATLPVPAPRSSNGPGTSAQSDEITITVKITREGYIVGAPGGFLQPGCRSVSAAALTVPLQGGQPDTVGLNQCMQTIRNNPEWAAQLRERHNVNIAVNGEVPYSVLVATLDAVRETRAGAHDMFYEPTLGLLQ